MNWLKENNYVVLFFAFACFIIFVLYVTDDKIEQYDYVTVQYGDTLWTLADQYRGSMTHEKWIAEVKEMNHLSTSKIQAGADIYIPIESSSKYMANKLKYSEQQSIEVASDL